jgi:hypothetical protein
MMIWYIFDLCSHFVTYTRQHTVHSNNSSSAVRGQFEDVLERKNVAKCQVYNFYVERFLCLHVKFGDPRAASFGFRESATQIQKMHTKSDVFRALFEQDIG